ncbi:MAG TPA: carbohydrate ABC transporter permease, partial [Candidatus Goldiibacteriota bacterium]|nr:carbohydrate ABC transporter permease [Candidatus Goldiibacteriota bacterium]
MANKIKGSVEETRYLFPFYEMKQTKSKIIFNVWGFLVYAFAILMTIPFVWMLITTMLPMDKIFTPINEALKGFSFNFDNYKKAWETVPFPLYFFNSFFVSIAVVVVQIVISSMAAYSLSKLKPSIYHASLILFLSTVLIPFETIAIPLYLSLKDFSLPGIFSTNLINTYWALILPPIANAVNIFIFKSFFDKLPDDFIESARVDGCSELKIFHKIILPISKPIIVVLLIINFVNIWNSFFWPLIVTNDPQIFTLMLGIYKIIEDGLPWNVVMSAVTISIIPNVILFMLFQKQIMLGVVFTTL